MEAMLVENAKVMTKGQITLPKDIRSKLKINTGDRVTLIYDNDQVIMMNSAIYAMRMLQNDMKGEAAKTGIKNDKDVVKLVREVRKGAVED